MTAPTLWDMPPTSTATNCPRCGRTFAGKDLDGEPYCYMCGTVYVVNPAVLEEASGHYGRGDADESPCPQCSVWFSNRGMSSHLRRCGKTHLTLDCAHCGERFVRQRATIEYKQRTGVKAFYCSVLCKNRSIRP